MPSRRGVILSADLPAFRFSGDNWKKTEPCPNRLLLGVTAIPKRSDGELLNQVYDRKVYGSQIEDAVREGWLVNLQCWHITAESNLDNVHRLGDDLKIDELAKAVNNRAYPRVRKGPPWNPLAYLPSGWGTRPPPVEDCQENWKARGADLPRISAQVPLNLRHAAAARQGRPPHGTDLDGAHGHQNDDQVPARHRSREQAVADHNQQHRFLTLQERKRPGVRNPRAFFCFSRFLLDARAEHGGEFSVGVLQW